MNGAHTECLGDCPRVNERGTVPNKHCFQFSDSGSSHVHACSAPHAPCSGDSPRVEARGTVPNVAPVCGCKGDSPHRRRPAAPENGHRRADLARRRVGRIRRHRGGFRSGCVRHEHLARASRRRPAVSTDAGKKSATAFKWSPDSRWLAFLSPRKDDKNQIFVIRRDGGEALQLTASETAVSGFEWSPDGRRIAFWAPEPESKALKSRKDQFGDYAVVRREYSVRAHLHRRDGRCDEDARCRDGAHVGA